MLFLLQDLNTEVHLILLRLHLIVLKELIYHLNKPCYLEIGLLRNLILLCNYTNFLNKLNNNYYHNTVVVLNYILNFIIWHIGNNFKILNN